MDISKITDIKELKATAYDIIRERERLATYFEAVNSRIRELEQRIVIPKTQETAKNEQHKNK